MTISTLNEYAICFLSNSIPEDRIRDIFSSLWKNTWENWNLPAVDGLGQDDDVFVAELDRDLKRLDAWTQNAWIQLGPRFYLLMTGSHCSQGDICGWIKGNNLIAEEDEVIAIPIDPERYIPSQGFRDFRTTQTRIDSWRARAKNERLVERPTRQYARE